MLVAASLHVSSAEGQHTLRSLHRNGTKTALLLRGLGMSCCLPSATEGGSRPGGTGGGRGRAPMPGIPRGGAGWAAGSGTPPGGSSGAAHLLPPAGGAVAAICPLRRALGCQRNRYLAGRDELGEPSFGYTLP